MPEPGGLRDQPAGLLFKCGYLLDVYNAHRSWIDALQNYNGDALQRWERNNQDTMKLMATIREARNGNG